MRHKDKMTLITIMTMKSNNVVTGYLVVFFVLTSNLSKKDGLRGNLLKGADVWPQKCK